MRFMRFILGLTVFVLLKVEISGVLLKVEIFGLYNSSL